MTHPARWLLLHHLLRLRARDPRPRVPAARGAGDETAGGREVECNNLL